MSKLATAVGAVTNKNAKISAIPKTYFKTTISAQMASAGPPLGPLLGQFGLNIGKFCKDFNEKTKQFKQGIPLPVTVRIRPDKSFGLEIETPTVEYYLKQAAGIDDEGSMTETAGKVTIKHIYEIAKIKNEDPYSRYQILEMPELVKQFVGLALNYGIEVVRDLNPEEYQEFLKERLAFVEERNRILEEQRQAKFNRS